MNINMKQEQMTETEQELYERICELRREAEEEARKKRAEREAERRRDREREIEKIRRKAWEKQRIVKNEELKELYERMALKRKEYSRYLTESSLQKSGEFEAAKRPKSMNVRAMKSYECSFMLDIRQQLQGIL